MSCVCLKKTNSLALPNPQSTVPFFTLFAYSFLPLQLHTLAFNNLICSPDRNLTADGFPTSGDDNEEPVIYALATVLLQSGAMGNG